MAKITPEMAEKQKDILALIGIMRSNLTTLDRSLRRDYRPQLRGLSGSLMSQALDLQSQVGNYVIAGSKHDKENP